MAETITINLIELVSLISGEIDVYTADNVTSTLYLRRFDASGVYQEQFAGTDNGHGSWSFTPVDGRYQLWKSAFSDTTPANRLDWWHGGSTKYRFIGDVTLPYLKREDEVGPSFDAESQEIKNGIAEITENTSYITGAEVDSRISTEIATAGADYALLDGGNDFTGNQSFQDNVSFDNDPPTCSSPPDSDAHLANKAYVDSMSYSNDRVIIVDALATEVEGKVYNAIVDAVAYCVLQTPSATKQYTVLINSMGNSATIGASAGSLKNYVNLVGIGKHIQVIFGDDTTILSVGTMISNMTCYFGANDVATPRSFTRLNFSDCKVYHYKDITFAICDLISTRFVGSESYVLIATGATNLDRCKCRNEPTTGASTGEVDYQTHDYTVPTDPSVVP